MLLCVRELPALFSCFMKKRPATKPADGAANPITLADLVMQVPAHPPPLISPHSIHRLTSSSVMPAS